MQDVGHVLHLNVAWQLHAVTLNLCASELSTIDKDGELLSTEQAISICFSFALALNKISLPVVVRTKAEKLTYIFTYQYISKLSKDMQSASKLCS